MKEEDLRNRKETVRLAVEQAAPILYNVFKETNLETHIAGTVRIGDEYFQLIFCKVGCEAPQTPYIK